MRLASLLIPTHLPRPHAAATPIPFASGVVDKFERELSQLVPMVIRHFNSARLAPDTNGRFVSQELLTRYDIVFENSDDLAKAVKLALASFKIEKVTVFYDADSAVEDMTAETVAELAEGLHEWSTD